MLTRKSGKKNIYIKVSLVICVFCWFIFTFSLCVLFLDFFVQNARKHAPFFCYVYFVAFVVAMWMTWSIRSVFVVVIVIVCSFCIYWLIDWLTVVFFLSVISEHYQKEFSQFLWMRHVKKYNKKTQPKEKRFSLCFHFIFRFRNFSQWKGSLYPR